MSSTARSNELLTLLGDTGALLEGHFVLRSGLHSRSFFQCAHLLQYPAIASKICQWLADDVQHLQVDAVISPAMGGLFIGHELGRHLEKRHIFVEKEDGKLVLRRHFVIEPGSRFLVAEDVITRGGRAMEAVQILREHGAEAAAVVCIVDRSSGTHADFGCPLFSLLALEVETYSPDALPADLAAIPAVHPGSK